MSPAAIRNETSSFTVFYGKDSGELYPGLTDITKPIVLELGNADPACFVPNLYDWLRPTKGNVVSIVVGGDHGLNVVSNNFDDPRNEANIAAGIQIVTHWINLILAK